MNTQNQTIGKLFNPIDVINITLQNRIVMAPMTRSRAIGNMPNELIANYYRQRATAGLIITEGVAPSVNALGYSRIPGIYSEEQVNEWKKITEAIHAEGGKVFMQLMHVGRIAHPLNMREGARIVAPSATAAKGDIWTDQEGMQPLATPEAMTEEDIQAAIEEFAQAAANAIAAGFDGVELHGANGYLLEQFLNGGVNTRTDSYGGTAEKRARFVAEVTRAVADKIGKEKTGVRLSPYNTYNDMPLYEGVDETYTALVRELDQLGIAYIHLVDYAARNAQPELVQTIRDGFTGVLIVNGGYTLERATEVIESGMADLVSFGAPFIANPDLPHRLKHNIALAQPDAQSFFSAGAEGYIDYAFAEPAGVSA